MMACKQSTCHWVKPMKITGPSRDGNQGLCPIRYGSMCAMHATRENASRAKCRGLTGGADGFSRGPGGR